MRPTAATRPSVFLARHQKPIPTSSRAAGLVAADPCRQIKNKNKRTGRSWRAASAGSKDGADTDGGQSVSTTVVTPARRQALLSARRRETIRLLDVVPDLAARRGTAASASSCGTPPAWSPCSTPGRCRASRRWSRARPARSGARCTRWGFWASRSPRSLTSASRRPAMTAPSRCSPAGYEDTLHLMDHFSLLNSNEFSLNRVRFVCGDKFEGSDSIEQQNELFSAVMRNRITWGYNGDREPCLDIDVNLEVTLEVYTKPFSLLPLSAVEKPGNLLMQGLLDRLVPLLGEQLLKDYHSWVQQQPGSSS